MFVLTRSVTFLVLLAHCAGVLAGNVDNDGSVPLASFEGTTTLTPPGVALFDLHDPGLMSQWASFLASTPMLNEAFLPSSLQNRLTAVVATYRTFTPAHQPEFFVATYLDLLSERLLAANAEGPGDIMPMRICPVFASGSDAPVSSLLAMASGLPDTLFVNAPGKPERYRYLFLQTEYSHCRFLATIRAATEPVAPVQLGWQEESTLARLTFNVGERPYTAMFGSTEELRALVETVGDIDAIAAFRQRMATPGTFDEAEVFIFIRLLSLLTTDGKSGYAAIPVLYPLLSRASNDESPGGAATLRVAEAMEHSFLARAAFREIVPFAIRDRDDLLHARAAVMRALSEDRQFQAADQRVTSLLARFVTGSGLLLESTYANEKMPPENY